MSIQKNGILNSSTTDYRYLVNNFTVTKTTTDWSFGGTSPTLSNGTMILTGTSPSISSISFTVNPNDIIICEFTVSIPTPSTTTGGSGLYLGTKGGQSVYVHTYNLSTGKWSVSSSVNTNPYFFYSYNSTTQMTMKSYIFGYNVDSTHFPNAECNLSINPMAIQLTGTDTTTYIRSGYNSNTSMVIHFSNPKIYRLNECGFNEIDGTAKIGNNFVQSDMFYEI